MKKIFVIFFGLFAVVSCKDIGSYDINPKAASTVDAGSLFANAEKNLADYLASPSVNLNIYRMLVQQWTETTYIDESNYDLSTRPIPQTVWHLLYRDVLKDLAGAATVVNADPILSAGEKQTQLAMIEVLSVLTYSMIVDTFGDVPYTQALNTNYLLPVYDDAATIYTSLLTRLDAAIANLSTDTFVSKDGTFNYDLIYGGDVASWKKFANSLKLRLGMNLADVNPTLSKTTVEAAASKVFTSNSDNASFSYLSATPNTNPIWVGLVQSGRKDFVAADTYVDAMNALSDPRRPFYFTPVAGGSYVGGIYGSNNTYTAYSHVADKVQTQTFPGTIMDYAEVSFYLAEAAARGYSVGATADVLYAKGIQASMDWWGVDPVSAAAYLAKPEVAYATATGTYKQKIGTQKWFALYNRGYEAWVEWRRLDYPVLVAPPDALSAIPVRYTYPVSEQNLNVTNYNAASTKIGGDKVTTKVFWDKF